MSANEDVLEVRSLNCEESSYVRFVNRARQNVGIYWVDYNGRPVLYTTLLYRHHLDINTYVTHPWVFLDPATKERYLVNFKDVYYPEPARVIGWREEGMEPEIERVTVFITLPMYSLRQLCIRMIKSRLSSDSQAYLLQLPRTLQHDIAVALPRKGNTR